MSETGLRYSIDEAKSEAEWMKKAAEWYANYKQPILKKALNFVTFRQEPTSNANYQTAEYVLALAALDDAGIRKKNPQLYIQFLSGEVDHSIINTKGVSLYPDRQPKLR